MVDGGRMAMASRVGAGFFGRKEGYGGMVGRSVLVEHGVWPHFAVLLNILVRGLILWPNKFRLMSVELCIFYTISTSVYSLFWARLFITPCSIYIRR